LRAAPGFPSGPAAAGSAWRQPFKGTPTSAGGSNRLLTKGRRAGRPGRGPATGPARRCPGTGDRGRTAAVQHVVVLVGVVLVIIGVVVVVVVIVVVVLVGVVLVIIGVVVIVIVVIVIVIVIVIVVVIIAVSYTHLRAHET